MSPDSAILSLLVEKQAECIRLRGEVAALEGELARLRAEAKPAAGEGSDGE